MGDDSSLTTYELTGSRESPNRMRVDTGQETFDVDTDVNPIEYLLGSLIGCLNFTATTVSREMNVDIEAMDAEVEGDIDYSLYKGVETDARAGLQEIRITLAIAADADDATLEELLAEIERRCPVSETLANGSSLDVTVESA